MSDADTETTTTTTTQPPPLPPAVLLPPETTKTTATTTTSDYWVASIDPGLTDGGLVVVDWTTMRLVLAEPFSLDELYIERYQREHGGRTPRRRLLTQGEVAPAVCELVSCPQFREPLRRCRHVLIEQQMRSKLNCVQTALQTTFDGRCTVSSPRSVRTYFGISVSNAGVRGNRRRVQREAYRDRKKLSLAVAGRHVSTGALTYLMARADDYWSVAARRQRHNLKTERQREVRRDKAYGDLVEACLQALFPGNWESAAAACQRAQRTVPPLLTRRVRLHQAERRDERRRRRQQLKRQREADAAETPDDDDDAVAAAAAAPSKRPVKRRRQRRRVASR